MDRLFLVPEGSLHLVNFAALPSERGAYLVESGPLIQYLSAERDLVRIPRRREGTGLLALGGASFDLPEGSAPAAPISESPTAPYPRRGSSPAGRGPQPECLEFRDTRFSPLPETAREVKEIAAAWGDPSESVTLTGAQAGETAFKALAPGRRVLHLATHGFFLDAARCAAEQSIKTRGIGGVAAGSSAHSGMPSWRWSPLLVSGLALAGANRRLQARPDQEDGILMAEEVVSLDLSTTEWVVLSACDTGLGRTQAGEGVLGLQRAFQTAGAGAVIMSLWEVEDRSTREWMRHLYESRFRLKRSTPEAVREADLAVLRDRRAQGLGTHPFYWASFVATGDWR